MTPSEFAKAAKEAGHDSLGLCQQELELATKDELVTALEKLAEKYPAVYRHFFLSELRGE